ncbi:MAG: hypothetical protein PHC51_05700 [bacterium]|nr:hypothetical protein [bacterium]
MNKSDLPFEDRDVWHQVVNLVALIRDYRIPEANEGVVFCPDYAGGAYTLPRVIGCVPGISSFFLGASCLNDTRLSTRDFTWSPERFVTGNFSDSLAVSNFLALHKLLGATVNPKRIVGMGISANIASTEVNAGKKGGQRVCVSARTSRSLVRVEISFKHSSDSHYGGAGQELIREYQDQICALTAVNLLADMYGLEKVPMRDKWGITVTCGSVEPGDTGLVIAGQTMMVDDLLPRNANVTWYDVHGINQGSGLCLGSAALGMSWTGNACWHDYAILKKVVLIPVSANPFTPAHDEMGLVMRSRGFTPVFVIGAHNAEKGEIDREELIRRASQFIGRWPVVVTKQMSTYFQMSKYIGTRFAIGGDTAVRIFEPLYCESHGGLRQVYDGLKERGVRFYVFPRPGSTIGMLSADSVPDEFQDLFENLPCLLNVEFSSSVVRSNHT